jgi:hypothetical protein
VTFISQKRLRNLEKFEEVCVSQEEDIFCSVMYLTKIILVLYTARQEIKEGDFFLLKENDISHNAIKEGELHLLQEINICDDVINEG